MRLPASHGRIHLPFPACQCVESVDLETYLRQNFLRAFPQWVTLEGGNFFSACQCLPTAQVLELICCLPPDLNRGLRHARLSPSINRPRQPLNRIRPRDATFQHARRTNNRSSLNSVRRHNQNMPALNRNMTGLCVYVICPPSHWRALEGSIRSIARSTRPPDTVAISFPSSPRWCDHHRMSAQSILRIRVTMDCDPSDYPSMWKFPAALARAPIACGANTSHVALLESGNIMAPARLARMVDVMRRHDADLGLHSYNGTCELQPGLSTGCQNPPEWPTASENNTGVTTPETLRASGLFNPRSPPLKIHMGALVVRSDMLQGVRSSGKEFLLQAARLKTRRLVYSADELVTIGRDPSFHALPTYYQKWHAPPAQRCAKARSAVAAPPLDFSNSTPPSVCVAIPCVPKHWDLLQRAIESVGNQTRRADQVVVVLSHAQPGQCLWRARQLHAWMPGALLDCNRRLFADSGALEPFQSRLRDKKSGSFSRGANRNVGVERCVNHSHVAFVDADDQMEPRRLETMMALLAQHRAELGLHGFHTHYTSTPRSNTEALLRQWQAVESNVPSGIVTPPARMAEMEMDSRWMPFFPMHAHGGHVIVRREVLSQLPQTSMKEGEDWESVRTIIACGFRAVHTTTRLSRYQVGSTIASFLDLADRALPPVQGTAPNRSKASKHAGFKAREVRDGIHRPTIGKGKGKGGGGGRRARAFLSGGNATLNSARLDSVVYE